MEKANGWNNNRKKSYFCTLNIRNTIRAMVIENYPNQRNRHCETGTILNMLKYYGYEGMSETMAFGLGSGFNFVYSPFLRMRGVKLPMFRIRPGLIAKNFCERMNIGFHGFEYGYRVDRSMAALDELVEKQIPVGMVVNVANLHYFSPVVNESNFNGHVFTVIGKEGTTYTIADTDTRLTTDDYVFLEEGIMRKSRFTSGMAAPRGKMFYIDPLPADFGKNMDLKPAVIQGLEETCRRMLRVPIRFYGWTGLHYFAGSLKRWKWWFSEKLIAFIMLWIYRLIETTGTGGAGHRYMYADFLKEAAELFGNEVLADCAELMSTNADTWRRFSLDCRRYMKSDNITLKEMAELLETIGQQEKQIFTKIDKEFLKPVLVHKQ